MTGQWSPLIAEDVPVLVVSPHLDDAVLSAFSFLRAPATTVLTVFCGIPERGVVSTWDTGLGFADGHEAMCARIAEDEAALRSLGLSAVRLPFFEDAYRPGPLAVEHVDMVRAAVRDWLAGTEGQGVVLVPAGAGGRENLLYRLRWRSSMPGLRIPGGGAPHPDHEFVRDVLLEQIRRRGHRMVLYEELPYRWTARGDRIVAGVAKGAGLAAPIRFEVRVNRAAKARAVAHYDSQTSGLFRPWVQDLANVLPTSERYWLVEPDGSLLVADDPSPERAPVGREPPAA